MARRHSMKPHERRAAGAYPYFKLAAWDGLLGTWKVVQKTFPTEAEARASAARPGRYRVVRIDEAGKEESEPFGAA